MKRLSKAISSYRNEYKGAALIESRISKNPLAQFEHWMDEAIKKKVSEPTAMTLATVNKKLQPSARIVLLKGIDKKGFVFYTNYKSEKGSNLEKNKLCCLNFFWAKVQRQVRIYGKAEKVSSKESDAYFASRPRASQVSVFASPQSEVIRNRAFLDVRFAIYDGFFKDKKIQRPAHWGGYRVIPSSIEFWQGRTNRLHDRLLFTKMKNGKWKLERLSP
jgi:pyridoxamine 5'-phosphate oxidase